VNEPTFTVAMPAYNAEATIAQAIRSVLAQTRDDFELIVVDDGSSDATPEIARSFDDPRIRAVRQENQGLGAARNRAVADARGRYVSMLDSDDLWLPAYLETMGNTLDADVRAGLAYTDAWVLDDETGRIRKTTAMHYQDPPLPPPLDPLEFLRLLVVRGNFVFTSTTVRRSALRVLAGFNMLRTRAEDYELWLRVVANGYRAIRASGILAVYRKRSGSLSTDELAMVRGEREAIRRVIDEYAVPDDIRRLARDRLRHLDARIAGLAGGPGAAAFVQRVRGRAVRAKIAMVEPFAYHSEPPAEVAALLAAANAEGEDARADTHAAVGGDRAQAQDLRADT
jgi:glycosyltransferase involved in cell wall biosynthesis